MKILFQGDSVTDAGRIRADKHHLGNGYPKFVSEQLKQAMPEVPFEFINLGMSGNRSIDLINRLQSDFLDVQPNLVFLLIGINDVWRRYDANDPTSTAQFETNCRYIMEQIKTQTKAKLILLEPFLVDCPEKPFREDLNPKIEVIRKLALEFADAYVPLDEIFSRELANKGYDVFTRDGIHPIEEGAKLIAKRSVDAAVAIIETMIKNSDC